MKFTSEQVSTVLELTPEEITYKCMKEAIIEVIGNDIGLKAGLQQYFSKYTNCSIYTCPNVFCDKYDCCQEQQGIKNYLPVEYVVNYNNELMFWFIEKPINFCSMFVDVTDILNEGE